MGIKGLSKGVIKIVWRDAMLRDLPRGTRVGVDAMGWLHKAVVQNAADICLEKGTRWHHGHFTRYLQQLLPASK